MRREAGNGEKRRGARMALLMAASLIAILAAGVALIAQSPSDAERLYRAGRFGEAYEAFQAIIRQKGSTPTLEYNSGNALYRFGRFEQAVQSFRNALAGPPALRERSYYNLGNSYVKTAGAASDKRGALRGAITAYEEALVIDPRDVDAKWNLELALRRLAEEEAGQSGGGFRHRANWGGGNLTKSGYAGRPEQGAGAAAGGGYAAEGGEQAAQELNEVQARRLLQAVQRAQVMEQESRNLHPPHMPSRRKDW